MKKLLFLMVALVSLCGIQRVPALIIIRDFSNMGTAPTNSTGTGDPIKILNVVCDRWERIFPYPWIITIHFKFAPVGGGQHELVAQKGNPNREYECVISFNNDNDPSHLSWYFTPNPEICFEATGYTEQSATIDGKAINVTRYYSWPTTGPQMDFYTAACHEVGHSLGLALANTTFMFESLDGYVNITSGMYTGMNVRLQSNIFGVTSHIDYYGDRSLMTGSWAPGERVFPSALDIVTLAYLCGFDEFNLNLLPELHIRRCDNGGAQNIELSWTPEVPAPAGMRYIVKTRPNAESGAWTTVDRMVLIANGVHTMTIPADQTMSYFTLTVEPIPAEVSMMMAQSPTVMPQALSKEKVVRSIGHDDH